MLHFWLYLSKARVDPRSVDDARIYLEARDNNAAHAITGYLHREDGCYVQYVEGPKTALDRLRRGIVRDWRHDDLRVLSEGLIPVRRFSGWDMAFTIEETTSFRRYQARRGVELDIANASKAEILRFMTEMIATGQARSVAEAA
ncbi:BLUF domain-containing protein [Salipiger sp. IMCC34102]|uniref:BLUF domain-containing protein n=1 Tax=Salipiger sp. IMCC34102 TaxID=2510647 RepID=UPI0013EDABC9|nr:BLUF domain-containing protein [Salipiger sp. IMCC34102]